jgi:hypothetical protein
MLRSPRVRDEDVELGPLTGADARGRGDVHAGIADRGRDPRQRPGGVFDVDDQVDCHRATWILPWPIKRPDS